MNDYHLCIALILSRCYLCSPLSLPHACSICLSLLLYYDIRPIARKKFDRLSRFPRGQPDAKLRRRSPPNFRFISYSARAAHHAE